ncbi:hypothetical protein AC1031_008670 [Aphanomyces cochlioides]|nr:hypothetical protein AC1031_008670 [Aphanomyces cochlioides]
MRILLFVVCAASVLVWGQHPMDRVPAQVRQVNRLLPLKFERRGKRHGEYIGEGLGSAAGLAVGTIASVSIGTVTGGNLGTRSGRSGIARFGLMVGGTYGADYGAKTGGFIGRQMDKFTKGGKQAKATAANAKKKKEEEKPPKGPILFRPAGYKPLTRTGSSPAIMQRSTSVAKRKL